jgi:hypothetical protein
MQNQHATQFEIVRATPVTAQPSATSRTVTFDRHASGRLGQQTEISDVEISAEDIAVLAQDPEYSSLPDDDTFNIAYFERVVQGGDDEPADQDDREKGKGKAKPVGVWSSTAVQLY